MLLLQRVDLLLHVVVLLGKELLSFIQVNIVRCNSENGVKIGKGSGEEDWNQKQEEVERIFCSFQFGLLSKTLAGWTSHLH